MDDILNSKTLTQDFVGLFLGKKLGAGMSRTVYLCREDVECVIKVEAGTQSFQNIMEWEFWQSVKTTKFKKWFAPCVAISACGTILIQKRADPIHKDQYPKKIPAFFSDRKFSNFGKIGKQFVCVDYGTAHILAVNKALNGKLRKADFWSDTARAS